MTKYNISKASVFFLNQFFALNISPTSSLISQNFITWSQIRHKNLNNIDLLNSSSTYHLNNNWRQFCSESFYCYFILLILEKLFDWPFATRYFLSNDYCFSWLNHKKQENDQAFIALQNEICLWIESQKKIILDKSEDFFGNFYQSLFSKSKRRRFGEFFTPTWLADDLSIRAIQTFFITRYSKSLSIKSPVSSTSTRFLLNSNSWKQNFSNTTFIKASFPNILDPSCGSGTFLLSVIRFYKTLNLPYQTILSKITGFDLNPVSVLMARFNILFEFLTDFQTSNQRQTFLRFLLRQKKTTFPSIFLCDSIQNDWVENIISERRPSDQWSKMFDIILGNPPWMNWDHLPLLYREKTKFLWEKYHLFNLSGKEARYGGSKKELAALMLYACADLFLKNNGFLAMVLPQSLFQTAKAGQGFRQFQLPRQNHQEFYRLRLLEINDYSAINPFPEVNSKTAAVLFQKDRSITHFPVPYFIWEKNRFSRSSIQDSQYFAKKKWAAPSDPLTPHSAFQILEEPQQSPNPSHSNSIPTFYQAQLGANTAGANGIYWLELIDQISENLIKIRNLANCSQKEIPFIETVLETDLIYPLLRWKDVDEFVALSSSFILIPQDPQTRKGIDEEQMKNLFPQTLNYLRQFENILKNRSAYQKYQFRSVFWSMYNINIKTFSPIKVVWRRMDKRIRAAVISQDRLLQKPIIPQETLSMVAVDSFREAHYLAARLNSESTQRKVRSLSIPGSKGFGSPGILSKLDIPAFDPQNTEHVELSQYGSEQWKQKFL